MKLKDFYKLEVLKFVSKFIKDYLSKCFDNYFLFALKIHNYSTRFASEYDWIAVMRCSKSLFQRSIRIGGHRLWNNLMEIKTTYNLNGKLFFNKLKKVLFENNVLFIEGHRGKGLCTVFEMDNFQQLMNSSEIELFLRYVHFMIFKSIVVFMPYFCERRNDFF